MIQRLPMVTKQFMVQFQFESSFLGQVHSSICCSTMAEYGDAIDQILRDKLVCGVNNKIQHKLLSELDLTFVRSLQLAQSMK